MMYNQPVIRKPWDTARNKSPRIAMQQNLESAKQEEPAYIIGIELEGVPHKINIYDSESPDAVIQRFCQEKRKINI